MGWIKGFTFLDNYVFNEVLDALGLVREDGPYPRVWVFEEDGAKLVIVHPGEDKTPFMAWYVCCHDYVGKRVMFRSGLLWIMGDSGFIGFNGAGGTCP